MLSGKIIIADSGPLIGLARIGRLDLLPRMAERIVIPRAVQAEVIEARPDAPGATEVAAQTWLEVIDPDPAAVLPWLAFVGRGEAEAIALARQEAAAVLLLDDLRARKLAASLGLRRMGTIALLGRARRAGLIPALKPELDRLVAGGIFISPSLIAAALREVGEGG